GARGAPGGGGRARVFDLGVGEGDLTTRARRPPDADGGARARGRTRISPGRGGCSIEEDFTADGPAKPWAGKSLSLWSPTEKRWRQTWVDDFGSYLTFVGGMDGKDMILVGEPKKIDGKTRQMRMVFTDITANALVWRWERTTDGGTTWTPVLVIEYRRRG